MARGQSPIGGDGGPVTVPTASPSVIPAAKRDKRRSQIADRVSDITTSFNANLRHHYDGQASAIQVDMNLILQADPYREPLLDDEEGIVKKIYTDFLGGKTAVDPAAEADFVSTVGKWYQRFVRDVNRRMEERDAGIAMLTRKFEAQQAEVDQQYQFRVRMAEEEHRILAGTVRERLVQSLTQRQARLLREKDMLDLNDSNSYLLHPSQYSLALPPSPGGLHNPRKTRHARHRITDPDDGPADLKRKRKSADADGGSPKLSSCPATFPHTPYDDTQSRMVFEQYQSSACSLDKLFTEKELNLSMNLAAVAATDYLVKLKRQAIDDGSGNPARLSSSDEGETGGDDDGPIGLPVPPPTHHLRSLGRGSVLDYSSPAMAGLRPSQPFAVPKYIQAISGQKANGASLMPTGLTQAEIDQDLLIMSQTSDSADDPVIDCLLDAACAPIQVSEYAYQALGDGSHQGSTATPSSEEPASRNSPMPSLVSQPAGLPDVFQPPGVDVIEAASASAGFLASLATSREGLLASIASSLSSSRQHSQAVESGRGGSHPAGGSTSGSAGGEGPGIRRTASTSGRRTRT